MESMMTARQVAELLGVHESWVYDQAVAGKLPSYKLGGSRRFDPEELRGWIVAHREAERGEEKSLRTRRRASASARSRDSAGRVEAEPTVPSPGRETGRAADDGRQEQPRLFET
jgi:excisionase family DNA binding protein